MPHWFEALFSSVQTLYFVATVFAAVIIRLAWHRADDQVKQQVLAEQDKLRTDREKLIRDIDELQQKRFDETVDSLRRDVKRANERCDEMRALLDQALRRVHLLEEENATLRQQANVRDQRILQLEQELRSRDLVVPPPQSGGAI
jgi:chromosome segregation ATPase